MSRNLKHSEWADHICEDVKPLLQRLKERHNIGITEIVFDMKGSYTYIYVDEALTKELTEELRREFSANEQLRIEENWFGCARDFISIESSQAIGAHDGKEKSFMQQLGNLFR